MIDRGNLDEKILITGPSNGSVDNVLLKLHKLGMPIVKVCSDDYYSLYNDMNQQERILKELCINFIIDETDTRSLKNRKYKFESVE